MLLQLWKTTWLHRWNSMKRLSVPIPSQPMGTEYACTLQVKKTHHRNSGNICNNSKHYSTHYTVADPGFAKGGADHSECRTRAYNEGLGRASSGIQGRGSKPPEAESLLTIFIQKIGQKLRISVISVIACPVFEADCFSQLWPAPTFSQWIWIRQWHYRHYLHSVKAE